MGDYIDYSNNNNVETKNNNNNNNNQTTIDLNDNSIQTSALSNHQQRKHQLLQLHQQQLSQRQERQENFDRSEHSGRTEHAHELDIENRVYNSSNKSNSSASNNTIDNDLANNHCMDLKNNNNSAHNLNVNLNAPFTGHGQNKAHTSSNQNQRVQNQNVYQQQQQQHQQSYDLRLHNVLQNFSHQSDHFDNLNQHLNQLNLNHLNHQMGVVEERVKVDRKRFEQMLNDENSEVGCDAESFFKQVMKSTNTTIMWPPKLKPGTKSKKDPHVRITGSPKSINAAKEIIFEQLDTRRNRVTMKMDVAFTDHSHIIGKGGRSIQRVMDETGCHIHFPDSNRTSMAEKSNQVSIAGSAIGVEQSRCRIREMLPITVQFELPLNNGLHSPPSLDPQSPQLQAIQQNFGFTIAFRYENASHAKSFHHQHHQQQQQNSYFASSGVITVAVRGTRAHVLGLRQGINVLIEYLSGFSAQSINVPLTMTLDVAVQHHAFIMGRSNMNIRSIMQSTGATITMPDALLQPCTSPSPSSPSSSIPGSPMLLSAASSSLNLLAAGGGSNSTSSPPPQPQASTSLSSSRTTLSCGLSASSSTTSLFGMSSARDILSAAGVNSQVVSSGSIQSGRKTAITIRGNNFDSVYCAWQELLGYLPLILIFDLKEGQELDAVQVTQLMDQMRQISILIKPKQRQNTKSIVVRGPERDSRLLFEVRRQILQLDESEVPVPCSNGTTSAGGDQHAYRLASKLLSMFLPSRYNHKPPSSNININNNNNFSTSLSARQQKSAISNHHCNKNLASHSGHVIAQNFNSVANNGQAQAFQGQSGHGHGGHPGSSGGFNSQMPMSIVSSCSGSVRSRPPGIPHPQQQPQDVIDWTNQSLFHQKLEDNVDYDFDHIKILASKAMLDRPVAERIRHPTAAWAGFGFSRSTSDSAIKQRLNLSQRSESLQLPFNSNATSLVNLTALQQQQLQNEAQVARIANHMEQVANIAHSHSNSRASRRSASRSPTRSPAPRVGYSTNNCGGSVGAGAASNAQGQSTQNLSSTLSLSDLLSHIGLMHYLDLFNQHDITDICTLFTLTENDLIDLGLPFLHRRKLMMALAELKRPSFEAAPGAERSRQNRMSSVGSNGSNSGNSAANNSNANKSDNVNANNVGDSSSANVNRGGGNNSGNSRNFAGSTLLD